MITAMLYGDIVAAPVARVAANGRPFWTANIRVAAGTDTLFIGVSTFVEAAGNRLMRLQRGSTVAAVGTLEATAWADKDGQQRSGWRLTASEVMSVYQARKRRDVEGAQADEPQ